MLSDSLQRDKGTHIFKYTCRLYFDKTLGELSRFSKHLSVCNIRYFGCVYPFGISERARPLVVTVNPKTMTTISRSFSTVQKSVLQNCNLFCTNRVGGDVYDEFKIGNKTFGRVVYTMVCVPAVKTVRP